MQKQSVLIIDDDEVDRYLLKRLLKNSEFDFNILEKDDGSKALEFLKNRRENQRIYGDSFPPAILFLDINMPIMRGPEFLRHFAAIREEEYKDSCIIMMFSSSERSEDRAAVMQYDFVKDYLVKGSFSAKDLSKRIGSVLEATAA